MATKKTAAKKRKTNRGDGIEYDRIDLVLRKMASAGRKQVKRAADLRKLLGL